VLQSTFPNLFAKEINTHPQRLDMGYCFTRKITTGIELIDFREQQFITLCHYDYVICRMIVPPNVMSKTIIVSINWWDTLTNIYATGQTITRKCVRFPSSAAHRLSTAFKKDDSMSTARSLTACVGDNTR